jgi:hypothetical protein
MYFFQPLNDQIFGTILVSPELQNICYAVKESTNTLSGISKMFHYQDLNEVVRGNLCTTYMYCQGRVLSFSGERWGWNDPLR